MLIEAIKSLLYHEPGGADADETPVPGPAPAGERPPKPDPVHLAACALLLEVAYADGEFTDDERAHLEDVLARHFQLPESAGKRLIEAAEEERRSAIDHYSFTSVLKANYDLGQKMVLAEVMWGLVLADGTVAEHEQYLTRKIANLLDLKPGYLSAAKKNAAAGGKA